VRATDPGSNIHDVLGQDCNALLQAHMVSINGIGIAEIAKGDWADRRG
jgi:hypothetical protein